MEVGPYRLKNKHKLEYNEGSWDEFANLLFVDNPVGTGFSYVNTDSFLHELDDMAAQFMVFLEKFFEMFPEYESDDVHDPLSLIASVSDCPAALPRRRVVCWATHSVYRQGHPRTE